MSEKKKHIPIVERLVDTPPPLFVAIVGPPKVSKMYILLNEAFVSFEDIFLARLKRSRMFEKFY